MNIEQLKFLAGASEAVMSRSSAELRTKGECLVLLADMIESENEKQKTSEVENGDLS
jgi:hypothetical protein